jgi:hypothetical protein
MNDQGVGTSPPAGAGALLLESADSPQERPMALYASWTPGIGFMPAETPSDTQDVNGIGWTGVVGLRQSGGTTFKGKGGTSIWFHAPIATPVIINGARAALERVFVMFQCGDPAAQIATKAGANITDIHVWDGAKRIKTFSGFMLFGDHRTQFDTSTKHEMGTPAPQIFYGVEIAVHVKFSQDQTVTFVSAGADFNA